MLLGNKPQPIFRKTLGGFVPINTIAEETHAKVKLGDEVTLTLRRPRNLAHHKKFWAIAQKVFENQEHYLTVEDVVTAFKFAISHTRKIRTKHGIIEIPESIAFDKMDQTEFEAFYERFVKFLISEVIPGLDRAELEGELLEMVV